MAYFRGKEEHRRGITACLVKATYIMESDRTKGRQGTLNARAPDWWKSFHFRLREPPLICDYFCECVFCKRLEATGPFIYGAIFEYAPPEEVARRHYQQPAAPPPRFVVAFRGTKLRLVPDLIDDVRILRNLQGACSRFQKAREHVAELLGSITGSGGGDGAVWLAGHSLGASVALDVGRDLMIGKRPRERRRNLPTFLFNPPHVSLAPVASTLRVSEAARQDWFSFKCVAKGLAACTTMRSQEKMMEDMFRRLGPWVPELYVHKDDKICQGYIDQFERQEKMLAKCTGTLRKLANKGLKHSFRDMSQSSSVRPNNTQGQRVDDEEEVEKRVQPHLLPSVSLWKNSTKISRGICQAIEAHKLKHWWKPDEELNLLSPKRYIYQA
ncbi:unnamed protein product [Urochloa humidicola]